MLTEKAKLLITKPTMMTSSNGTSWLNRVSKELDLVESRLREAPAGQHDMLSSTIEALFSAGGKRIRPALTLLTSGVFDTKEDHAVALAAASEMLHTATLVHDDLIDGAMLRRGAPTINAIWSSDISVLVGDYLFARAASLVAQINVVDIMGLFADTLAVILNGEITQKFTKWQIDRGEYNQRIYAKTAALFVLCTQSAAILGKADPDQLAAMIQFGNDIGMAFQIVDDILDYVGSANKVGKPIGGDLRQGLFTLPIILYDEIEPHDKDVQFLLKRREGEPEIVDRLITKVLESGAIQDSLDEAQMLVEQAQDAIDILPESRYKEALMDLADQVVNREM
jgi:geranylgeranyl pyrophosphate synthase